MEVISLNFAYFTLPVHGNHEVKSSLNKATQRVVLIICRVKCSHGERAVFHNAEFSTLCGIWFLFNPIAPGHFVPCSTWGGGFKAPCIC